MAAAAAASAMGPRDESPALRRKIEDLSRQHEMIVSGLTAEVDRLHNVCHGLMLQLVLNGLSPSVVSGTDEVHSVYESVLQAVRAGDLQLPPRADLRPAVANSVVAPPAQPPLLASEAQAGPSAMAPAMPTRDAQPARSRAGLGSAGERGAGKALAPPPEPSADYHVPAPGASPGRSSASASPTRPLNTTQTLPPITREVPGVELAALGSPARSRADAGAGGSPDPLALTAGSTSTEPFDVLGSPPSVGVKGTVPAPGASGMPRVLRKGGAVGSGGMRRPRTLAPLHTTERSAMGGTRARGAHVQVPCPRVLWAPCVG